jgi:hypothetical protein
MKVAKFKAHEIYAAAIVLHGEEHAKQEAINSATATHALAPFEQQKYWKEVITLLEGK